MSDEDKQKEIIDASIKIIDIYDKIRRVMEEEMLKFSYDELNTISVIYGKELTYPMYQDINDALAGPEFNDTVH